MVRPNNLDKITLKMSGMDELKDAMNKLHRCYEEMESIVGWIGGIYEKMGLELNLPRQSDLSKDDN